MDLLRVDRERCKKDGVCAAVCPTTVVRLQGPEGYPRLVPGGDRLCIACGHCVAVCPHGALDHARVPREACPPVRPELRITQEQAVQFLRSRRSIRLYDDRPLDRATVQRLIEIARYAPTGSNSQLVEWVAFSDRSAIRELAAKTVEWIRSLLKRQPPVPGLPPYLPLISAAWDAGIDAVLRNAPALVIAAAPADATNGMVDLSLALCYLELAAPVFGLGTCWAGILRRGLVDSSELREAAGIPKGYPHFYPMMLGYPKHAYHRLPERKPPKITWL